MASDQAMAPVKPFRQRIARPLIGMVLVLALYAGAGFIAVPVMARHYALQTLGELLGREVSVEQIGFNPFTLAAEFRNLRIMGNKGDAPSGAALSLGRVMVNFELASLWRGGPVVRELVIGNPRLRLARLEDGRYDCSDVIERFQSEQQADNGDDSPVLFSVSNIRVEDGLIEVEDRVTGATHTLSNLKLGIPTISRLAVQVDTFVEPEISMLLDGRTLAAKGRLEQMPDGFRATLEQLALRDFDLPSWLSYLPFEPSFRLASGVLDLDLRLEFEQRGDEKPTVIVRGRTQVNRLSIQDRAGKPVFAAAELEAELGDIRPLADRYRFGKLRLQQPELDIIRLPDGGFNIAQLLPSDTQASGKTKTAKPVKSAKPARKGPEKSPLDIEISLARIRDGLIRYSDRAVEGGFSSRVEAIQLDLRDLSSAADKAPAEIRLDYTTAAGERFSHQDRLRLHPLEYSGNLTVKGFQPALYGRYYTAFLPGGAIRQGRADGVFRYRVAEEGGTDGPFVEAGIEQLTLSDFVLGLSGRKNELLKFKTLAASGAEILPAARRVRIGEIKAQDVVLSVVRLPNGHFDFMTLMGKPSPASAPWVFQLGSAAVSDASLRFEDRAAAEPAVMTADGIEVRLNDLSTRKGDKPANIVLRGRIDKSGRLSVKGSFVPEPLRTDLGIDLQDFGLPTVQPYIAHHAQAGIRTGRLSAKGQLALRQQPGGALSGSWSGHLTVNNFSSIDHINNAEFVRWNEFAARQARIDLEPFALSAGEVSIDGLSSRLILDESGKLNLREIQQSAQASAPDSGAENENAENRDAGESASAVAAPKSVVNIARIGIRNSNIAFTDRFIRPHYNVLLENLSGELTGLSSDQSTLAKLALQGKVGRTASLAVKGEFNPFRQDRHLNIGASVKDFELAGLSGYSGRYIGYGISRGKLSATLNYRIEDRKLSAENHVFLDQLTFGDSVESQDATKLPVRLAVALLKNPRGEIDIRLPVGGTLDDPQFSVFGLVLRAFTGLIAKAVTAPFALLGKEELSFLDFDPGSFRIGTAQEDKLRNLAKVLEERPLLKLDITGLADAGRDTDGIRRGKLRNMLIAEKRKAADKNGALDDEELGDGEYATLLGEVYDDAKIRKPRNFIGLTKKLPVEEMERLLLTGIDVGAQDIDELARRREAAVQRWLTDQGGIPPERIFRRALTESEIKETGRKGNGVRFSLR